MITALWMWFTKCGDEDMGAADEGNGGGGAGFFFLIFFFLGFLFLIF